MFWHIIKNLKQTILNFRIENNINFNIEAIPYKFKYPSNIPEIYHLKPDLNDHEFIILIPAGSFQFPKQCKFL